MSPELELKLTEAWAGGISRPCQGPSQKYIPAVCCMPQSEIKAERKCGQIEKEHTRSQDQEIFAMSSLDTEHLRTFKESILSRSSHHYKPYQDGRDYLRVSAASVLQASKSNKVPHSLPTQVHDAKGRYFLSHKLMDSEHKLLSSPLQARTSLHSQIRSRAESGKERFHVSFSEDSSSDVSPDEKETGQKMDLLDFGQDVSSKGRLNSNSAGKFNSPGLARDHRLGSCESLCLASSTHHRELHKRLADDRKAANNVHHYSSVVVKEALAAARSSCRDFRGQYLETDSHPESSLKRNLDAKLNNQFLPTSAGFGDSQSKSRFLLDEKKLEDSPAVSVPLSVTQRGREPPISRSLSLSRVEFKHNRSPTYSFKETNKEHQHNEQKRGHIWTGSPLGAEKSSPVIFVLHQFLELVDRYWDGSGSLILNKDFLAPALDLLRNLMAATPLKQDDSSTAVAAQSSNSTSINYRIPKDLPKDSLSFSGQKPDESQVASFKRLSKETSAPLNYNLQEKCPFSYDELLSRNEQLSAQVHVLTSELKQLKNQQDTINILCESQKSLASTNSFLLQQLKKEQGSSSAKGALLSEKTAASTKAPFFERTSPHAPSSSAFGSSQLCSSQQLSSCPL